MGRMLDAGDFGVFVGAWLRDTVVLLLIVEDG